MQCKVQDAKRTLALPYLPPYQTELVRAITREIQELDKDASATLAPYAGSFDPSQDPAAACSVVISHLCMRRNKRCLLAYHRIRTNKLEGLCWRGQDILEENTKHVHGEEEDSFSAGGESNQNSLSPEEEEYVRRFGDMLAAYKGQWTDIDLTGSLEPPRDLFIDVRVLKDAGEIQTEYG